MSGARAEKRRRARTPPRVGVIYLPPRPDGGKVGLDDFFASGRCYAQLLGHATDELKSGPEERPFPYKETPTGLVYFKPTQNGSVEIPLANYTARIITDLREDDGIDVRRVLEIEVTQGKRKETVKVPADRFATLNWAIEALGAKAIIAAAPV